MLPFASRESVRCGFRRRAGRENEGVIVMEKVRLLLYYITTTKGLKIKRDGEEHQGNAQLYCMLLILLYITLSLLLH